MCTMRFSSSSCIPVQCLLLNSFWIMFSLTLAYFPPFQTILSEVSIRFYLLRDVNLSVCLKWWLIFDTENPVIFVTPQASNVLRLHTLISALAFPGAFCIYLTSLVEFNIHDVILSVCLNEWLVFDTENPGIFVTSQASNVLRLHTLIFALGFSGASCICLTSLVEFKLHDGNLSVCLKWWLIFDTENPGISVTSQASNKLHLHSLIFALGFSSASCIYLTSLVEFNLHDDILSVCLNEWLIFDTENPGIFVTSQASNVLRLHTLIFALGFSGASRIYLTSLIEFKLHDGNLSVCLKWWLTFDTENPVIFVTPQASNVLRLDSLIVALGFSGASCIYLTSLVEFKLHDGNLSVCLIWWLIFDTENPGISVTSQASNVLRLHTLIFALGFSGASRIYLTSLIEFKLHDGNLSVCLNRWFTVDTDNPVVFDFQLFCFGLSMVHVYHAVFELILYSCSMSFVEFVLDYVFINTSLFSSVPNHSEWGFDSFLLAAWC